MVLFGLKKDKKASEVKNSPSKAAQTKTVKNESPVAVNKSPVPSLKHSSMFNDAIIRPRITEKSGLLSQNGVYTFEVSKNINKHGISKAIFSLYKVVPTKVAIINLPSKNVFVRGKKGVVTGKRKAIVTLKKGDKIDFV